MSSELYNKQSIVKLDHRDEKGTQLLIPSIERLPGKRQTAEDLTVQDWMQKIQRSNNFNAKLEKELETQRTQYDQLYRQKEAIRIKAKELTETVKGIYVKYDELENLVRQKDEEIARLNKKIKEIQCTNSRTPEKRPVQLFISPEMSSAPAIELKKEKIDVGNTNNEIPVHSRNGGNQDMEEFEKIIFQFQERERVHLEECAMLRARVTELEGTLSGTIYHSAMKGTPRKSESFIPSSSGKIFTPRREVRSLVDALQSAARSSQAPSPALNQIHHLNFSDADETNDFPQERLISHLEEPHFDRTNA